MFVSRWYMTHSEPLSVMNRMMAVKMSANAVQPRSDRKSMCRK